MMGEKQEEAHLMYSDHAGSSSTPSCALPMKIPHPHLTLTHGNLLRPTPLSLPHSYTFPSLLYFILVDDKECSNSEQIYGQKILAPKYCNPSPTSTPLPYLLPHNSLNSDDFSPVHHQQSRFLAHIDFYRSALARDLFVPINKTLILIANYF